LNVLRAQRSAGHVSLPNIRFGFNALAH
jgi:hypothetical protein